MLASWKRLRVGLLAAGCIFGWLMGEGHQRVAMTSDTLVRSLSKDTSENQHPDVSSRVGLPNLGQQFVRGTLPCFDVWLRPGIEINIGDVSPPLVQGRREVCQAFPRKIACRHRSAYGSYTNIAKTYQCLKECAQVDGCQYSNLKFKFENVRDGDKSALEASFSVNGVRVRCYFVEQSEAVNIDLYGDGLQTLHRIWSSMFNCGR